MTTSSPADLAARPSQIHSILVQGEQEVRGRGSSAAAGGPRHLRRRGKRDKKSKLAHGLPYCFEHARPRPGPDQDGWQWVPTREERRALKRQRWPSPPASPPAAGLSAEVEGRCLICLSFNHRIATCRVDVRYLRWFGYRHMAKDCKRPRTLVLGSGSSRFAGVLSTPRREPFALAAATTDGHPGGSF